MMERQHTDNTEFQAEIRATIEALRARREEAARSTRHGQELEDSVGELLRPEAQRQGDSFEAIGTRPGARRHCKVGDFVVTISPESRAPGARIVIEAKENASYDVTTALAELATARENREASVGIFVFSRSTAPVGLEPLARHGDDILVVWDRDELAYDVYLKAALSIARAIVVRAAIGAEETAADFGAIDKADGVQGYRRLGRGHGLDWQYQTRWRPARLDRVAKVHRGLQQQLEVLEGHIEGLRARDSETE